MAWVPEFMRLGNLLTVGGWAHERPGRKVLLHPVRADALRSAFPTLAAEYFIDFRSVRLTDQRLSPWKAGPLLPDKSPEALAGYVGGVLLPGSPLPDVPGPPEGSFVVNVRRGDYYSVDQHRAEYGMPILSYLETAVEHAINDVGFPKSVHVVSDDIPWCRDHLSAWLRSIAPLTFGEGGMVHDLAALARAETLILPNSTFSYWGGFIGDQLTPGRRVYVPWLFSRAMDGGSSRSQVSPQWQVIDLPDGWPVPEG